MPATPWISTYRHTLALHDALPISAEREPVDGPVLERVFRVGRAAEAVVAVVAAGDGHLQRIEDRHVEFDECGLDVTADLGQVVLRVARRTEHPCVAQRGVRDRKSTRLNSRH